MVWGPFHCMRTLRTGLVGFTGIIAPYPLRLDSFQLFPTAYCFPSPFSSSVNNGGSPPSPAHVFHCFSILSLQSSRWFIVLSAVDLKISCCLPVCIHHLHLWRFITMVTHRLLWKKLGSLLSLSRSGFYGLRLFSILSSGSQYYSSDHSSLEQSHVSCGNTSRDGCKCHCLFFSGVFVCLFCFVF